MPEIKPTDAEVLLSPFPLRDLVLKNRVVMSPLTRARAGRERLANALMAEYYVQRASAGLLITEATAIFPQAIGWLNSPGIYTDAQAVDWKHALYYGGQTAEHLFNTGLCLPSSSNLTEKEWERIFNTLDAVRYPDSDGNR
jgi:hypothetical protein